MRIPPKEPILSPNYARLDKAPKLSGQSLNTKGTIIEDVRSGNFSRAWNSNIGHYEVRTQPQMVTLKNLPRPSSGRTLRFTSKRKWEIGRIRSIVLP
jgi:hypothetical protein